MAEEQQEQVLGVVAQYTKDLSFENINPISQITASNEQPNIDVQLKVNTNKAKQKDVYNVELITEITAKVKDTTLFVAQLNYCGEFLIKGFDEELMNPILYIECPRLLFPFARSIIANAVNEGGFPPLFLAPVDFAGLYQQQMESQNQVKQ